MHVASHVECACLCICANCRRTRSIEYLPIHGGTAAATRYSFSCAQRARTKLQSCREASTTNNIKKVRRIVVSYDFASMKKRWRARPHSLSVHVKQHLNRIRTTHATHGRWCRIHTYTHMCSWMAHVSVRQNTELTWSSTTPFGQFHDSRSRDATRLLVHTSIRASATPAAPQRNDCVNGLSQRLLVSIQSNVDRCLERIVFLPVFLLFCFRLFLWMFDEPVDRMLRVFSFFLSRNLSTYTRNNKTIP